MKVIIRIITFGKVIKRRRVLVTLFSPLDYVYLSPLRTVYHLFYFLNQNKAFRPIHTYNLPQQTGRKSEGRRERQVDDENTKRHSKSAVDDGARPSGKARSTAILSKEIQISKFGGVLYLSGSRTDLFINPPLFSSVQTVRPLTIPSLAEMQKQNTVQ